ncbi:hypothetical protein ACIRVK_21500 [Streptomyces sp. NPDC101152]|uniref:hypothetical protein n=1 Tax=Streptomyces sp. NPDC101152 TaxID=3366116 RepID=UPI00381BE4A1
MKLARFSPPLAAALPVGLTTVAGAGAARTSVYVDHCSSGAWRHVTSRSCAPLYSDGRYGHDRALKSFAAKGSQTGGVWSGSTYLTVLPGSPS